MSTNLRTQIWSELHKSKFQIYFYDEYTKRYTKLDRYTNAGLSVLAFVSMSAWAIVDDYPKLWSTIIAITAIYSFAVKPYFSFERALGDLRKLNTFLTSKFLELEKLFHDLDYKFIDETSAHNLYFKLRNELDTVGDIINIEPYDSKWFKKRAEERVAHYVEAKYGISK